MRRCGAMKAAAPSRHSFVPSEIANSQSSIPDPMKTNLSRQTSSLFTVGLGCWSARLSSKLGRSVLSASVAALLVLGLGHLARAQTTTYSVTAVDSVGTYYYPLGGPPIFTGSSESDPHVATAPPLSAAAGAASATISSIALTISGSSSVNRTIGNGFEFGGGHSSTASASFSDSRFTLDPVGAGAAG